MTSSRGKHRKDRGQRRLNSVARNAATLDMPLTRVLARAQRSKSRLSALDVTSLWSACSDLRLGTSLALLVTRTACAESARTLALRASLRLVYVIAQPAEHAAGTLTAAHYGLGRWLCFCKQCVPLPSCGNARAGAPPKKAAPELVNRDVWCTCGAHAGVELSTA